MTKDISYKSKKELKEVDLIRKSNELINNTPFNKVLQLKIFTKVILEITRNPGQKDYVISVNELTKSLKTKGNNYKAFIDIMDTMGDLMVYKGIENGKRIMKALFLSIGEDDKKSYYRFEPSNYLLENIGKLENNYTQYFFKNIIHLNSVFSIKIYELIKQINANTNFRIYEIEDLKEILGIKDKYKLYSHFKARVLIVAQKELKKKTDVSFDFVEYKEKRKVIKIKFIRNINNIDEETKDYLNNDIIINKVLDFGVNKIKIQSYIKEYSYDRIKRSVLYLEDRIKKDKISNLAGYFIDVIENDWGANIKKSNLKEEKRIEIEQNIIKKEEEEKNILNISKVKNKKLIEKYLRIKEKEKEKLVSDFYEKYIKGSIYENFWKDTNYINILENNKLTPLFRIFLEKSLK